VTPPTAQEQDGSLAALIGALADGQPVTRLDKDLLRLKLVHQAKDRGLTWAQIGSVYGLSGREMKRDIHALDRRVQRELMTARRGS
jgi:hypothetical protein